MLYFTGKCPSGEHAQWIMNSTTTVPESHISIFDPELGAQHNVNDARPINEMLKFYRLQTNEPKPSVTVDIDHKDYPHSFATVFAVKIYNDNLETVNIYKKETDTDETWNKVYTGTIPSNGEIMFPTGEQMGMIKIEPETGSETKHNEKYIFNFDVAICEYGISK